MAGRKSGFQNYHDEFVRELEAFGGNGYVLNGKYKLYEGTQREAFDGYLSGVKAGHRHGYIELPTGTGKTPLFIGIIKNYLRAVEGKPDAPRVLIAVPTLPLGVQTARSLAKFLPELAEWIETDDDQGREIDWKKSNIGLQMKRIKHAARKPAVLVTTYQSLIQDKEDKTYPPSEYGLVVYDEGHSITAPRFGMAVEKFKDAIQLAVTATPEYTEEKTVAMKLPHRYFTLQTPERSGIAEGINRGDLCNVRPVLLKTNFRVDEKKFAEEIRKRQGHPLTEKQLGSLLNQVARNRAVIETYLLGGDPDSGERYLGQSGLIYCGGTDHADDIARQFQLALKEKAYRPVKQWLDEEGIELIASVHGKVKGAWLKPGLLRNKEGQPITEDRQRQGNSEWYSEDEILDLHRRGRILLLASAQKIKWGFDNPRVSWLADLGSANK
jgi:superfamily II DNA or RNA helicase